MSVLVGTLFIKTTAPVSSWEPTLLSTAQLFGAFNRSRAGVGEGLLIILGGFIKQQTLAQGPERVDLPSNSGS